MAFFPCGAKAPELAPKRPHAGGPDELLYTLNSLVAASFVTPVAAGRATGS